MVSPDECSARLKTESHVDDVVTEEGVQDLERNRLGVLIKEKIVILSCVLRSQTVSLGCRLVAIGIGKG